MEQLPSNADRDSAPSCEKSLSRKEFLTKVLRSGAAAGALLAAPVIADKFLIPAAQASGASSCSTADTGGFPSDTTGFTDATNQNATFGSGVETGCTLAAADNTTGTNDCVGTICGG